MTMVGGKMIVLQQALATDFGMTPVGPQVSFKDSDVAHIGKPIEEIAKLFKDERPSLPQEAP